MPGVRWACQAQKVPWRNSCAVCSETSYKQGLSPSLQMICIVVVTALMNLSQTGRVLQALQQSRLCFSPSKTTIAPKKTVILGWIWESGTIRASPHRISSLATCAPPKTVKGMRSFIGAYKVLARVLPGCSAYLSPLDETTAGKQSQDHISWSDELLQSFQRAQSALPQASDQL